MEVEEWGKRRLAYAIDYKTEGHLLLDEWPPLSGGSKDSPQNASPIIIPVSREMSRRFSRQNTEMVDTATSHTALRSVMLIYWVSVWWAST